jgi:hypothetical protein
MTMVMESLLKLQFLAPQYKLASLAAYEVRTQHLVHQGKSRI